MRASNKSRVLEPSDKRSKNAYIFVPYQAVLEAFGQTSTVGEPELPESHTFPLGDLVLVALRQIITHTYLNHIHLIRLETALLDIRRIAEKTLAPLNPVLIDLNLPELGPPAEDSKPYIFKLVVAPAQALQSQLDSTTCRRAEPAIRGLRKVLSLTYKEVHTGGDYSRVLQRLRKEALDTLRGYEDLVSFLSLEPLPQQVKHQRPIRGKRTLYAKFPVWWLDYEKRRLVCEPQDHNPPSISPTTIQNGSRDKPTHGQASL